MTNDQARLFQLLEDFKKNIAMAKPSEDLEEEISQLLDRVDPNTTNDQGLSLLRQMVDLDFDNRYNPSYKLAQHMVTKLVHRGANPFGEEGPLRSEKRRLIQLF